MRCRNSPTCTFSQNGYGESKGGWQRKSTRNEKRKRKADSTLRSSQAVPHPSTNRALCRLTSEVERDPVHSTRYGRQRYSFNCTSCVQFKAHTSIHRHRQAQTDTERADTDRHRQPQADTDRHTQPHTATQRQNDTKGRGEVCVCEKGAASCSPSSANICVNARPRPSPIYPFISRHPCAGGHADLLCVVPILADDPRRESDAHI